MMTGELRYARLLCIIVVVSFCAGCNISDNNDTGEEEPDPPVKKVVSTYIRTSFYETGRISDQSLLHNNDIIYLAAQPYADGELFFRFPVSNGKLTNAEHLDSYEGRSGVLDFAGEGASMNAGKNLLNEPTSGATSFTFASWVYIDSWRENSYIFQKKSDWKNRIDIQLGPQKVDGKLQNRVYLHIADGENHYAAADNSGLTAGQWHHIVFTYQGNASPHNQVKFYVDGEPKELWYSSGDGTVPPSGPFIRSDFKLGVNFDGKLDETNLNLFSLGQGAINELKNGPLQIDSWNETKTTTYWTFDDAKTPGKDSRTWVGILDNLKKTIGGNAPIKLRLGLAGGAWKTTFASNESRDNFVNNIKRVVSEQQLDGVDFDFEWATNSAEWQDYSEAIVATGQALPSSSRFTVSLHALYYNISTAAIDAVDYASIQAYGPSPVRFSYNEFVSNVQTVLDYGFPKDKLVMGLPFYAVTSDGSKIARAYYDIVKAHPNLDPSKDEAPLEVTVNSQMQTKQFTFNGQETIRKKADYVISENLAGVMYWDVATDVDYANDLSLLKALNSKVDLK